MTRHPDVSLPFVRELTEEAVRQAIEVAPDGILIADVDGTVAFANPMACTLFGYAPDELVGQKVEILIPSELRAAHETHRDAFADRQRARPMGSGLDLRGLRKSGEEFPVEISLSPVTSDHGRHLVVAVVRDVTERQRAAEELMGAHEELTLADDRERIARDLHDTVIQRLFAVGLSLQGALTRTAEPAAAERIERAIDEIDGTIRDIRTAIFALHTRQNPSAGPRDDVLTTTREAARALGFEPQVHFDGLIDSAITPVVREHLIPTLREALSNVARHAHATRVAVWLEVDTGSLSLRVIDNGVGISDTATGGRGLANVAERAHALGGSCNVSPTEDGGTLVDWRIPLSLAD